MGLNYVKLRFVNRQTRVLEEIVALRPYLKMSRSGLGKRVIASAMTI